MTPRAHRLLSGFYGFLSVLLHPRLTRRPRRARLKASRPTGWQPRRRWDRIELIVELAGLALLGYAIVQVSNQHHTLQVQARTLQLQSRAEAAEQRAHCASTSDADAAQANQSWTHYLSERGLKPTSEVARALLADAPSDKRAALADLHHVDVTDVTLLHYKVLRASARTDHFTCSTRTVG